MHAPTASQRREDRQGYLHFPPFCPDLGVTGPVTKSERVHD
jgi:hypothetical protein